MERRELYEPEDIEQLLIERAYDDLLEEERAFVLRHLSGRTEYEAMRALLLNVHDDAARIEPLDAGPAVREHLMDVFRAEQRPQWRIWLNSVHAFLLPKEASAMWRPALALGSVALVVWLAVIGTRTLDQANEQQLAELKQPRNIEDGKTTTPEPQVPVTTILEESTPDAQPTVNPVVRTDALADDATPEEPATTFDMDASVASRADAALEPEPPPAPGVMLDVAETEDLALGKVDAVVKAVAPTGTGAIRADTFTLTDGVPTHVVTSDELARNFSYSNATVLSSQQSVSAPSIDHFASREKAKKTTERKRSLIQEGDKEQEATADAGAYLGLLRSAW